MDQAEKPLERGTELVVRGFDGGRARDHEDVPAVTGVIGAAAEDLTDAAAHTVTLDGASEASSGRDAEAVVIAAIGYEADGQVSIRPGATLPADAREVLPGTKCRHGPLQGQPAISS